MKKSIVENALYFAKKGCKLFPAKFTRTGHKGLIKWGTESTDDPAQIKKWGQKFGSDAYFCVALQQSGLTVVDVDVKNQKEGFKSLAEWEEANGKLPESFTSTTPNSGVHIFFKGLAKVGANRLGRGVDIPGMVPLPGSHVPGKGRYEIKTLKDFAELPKAIGNGYQKNADRIIGEKSSVIQEDQPQNIKAAINYLQVAATPAVEGDGGDHTTYRTLAYLFDNFALSIDKATQIGIEYYNPRCEPPWSDEDFRTKVENAYRYMDKEPGSSNVETDFQPLLPKGFIQVKDMQNVQANWLVKGIIEDDTHTLWYGETGSYKSFLALDLALHIALGMDWLGRKTKRGPVLIIAGEGQGGLSRRVNAWRKHHNISQARWDNAQVVFSKQPMPFMISDKAFGLIEEAVETLKPALIVVDTLSRAMAGMDENSVKDVTAYIEKVDSLRKVCGSTIISVHHTGHSSKDRPRGSYSLMAGVDSYFKIESPVKFLTCMRAPGKMKDGTPPPDEWFQCDVVQIGVDEDLESITSLVTSPLENRALIDDIKERRANKDFGVNEQLIIDLLAYTSQMKSKELIDRFKRAKERGGGKFHRQAYNRDLKKLETKGYLRMEDNYIIKCGSEKATEEVDFLDENDIEA